MPGVTRTFTGFQAAADEAGLSRILAGQHTRIDHVAGQKLGRLVADFVLDDSEVHLRVRPNTVYLAAKREVRRLRRV